MKLFKVPVSVLVVIYVRTCKEVLLLERAQFKDYWQSVTGALDYEAEPLLQAARREVCEETGIEVNTEDLMAAGVINYYEIYPVWRHRYAPGVTQNKETVFHFPLNNKVKIGLSKEHRGYTWLPLKEAANKCFSPSNKEAILRLA